MTILECQNLTVEIGSTLNRSYLVKNLDLHLSPGQVLCILGQNGSGKTSLLRVLAGLNYITGGHISISGKDITQYKRKNIAKMLGLVAQTENDPFPLTVYDFALAGRNPYLGLLEWESHDDKEHTLDALEKTSLQHKQKQLVQTLSGGERKRLSIARLLTQDPEIMLWDEPTNHLDPAQQNQILDIVLELKEKQKAQIIALHDVNHAALIATHILFLYQDDSWEFGTAESMLTAEKLSHLYQTPFSALNHKENTLFSFH